MRIVIADDHFLFAEGLKNLLEARGHQVIALACNGFEAVSLAEQFLPEVMLIDIFMPECDGLEAAMLINAKFPSVRIVILTSSEDEKDIFNAMKSGAHAYFIKSFESEKLFAVLDALQVGEIPVSPGLAGKILDELYEDKPKPQNASCGLTERQREVLALAAQGYYYKDIAEKLGISERTVKYHIQSAIDKLHLQNRSQLIKYAAKFELLE